MGTQLATSANRPHVRVWWCGTRLRRFALATAALAAAVLLHPARPSGAVVSERQADAAVMRRLDAPPTAIERLRTPIRPQQGGGGTPGGAISSLATYLGSNLDDEIVAVETDAAGNLIVFGKIIDNAPALSHPFVDFFGPTPAPGATHDCFLTKVTPDTLGDRFQVEYFALIHDTRRCDALAVAPTGDVYIARTTGDSEVVIEHFSNGPGTLTVTRVNRIEVPHLARVTHLRVDDQGNSYAVGECANEANPGDLWPLPNGYQPGPGSFNPPCVDSSNAGQPGGQYLMLKIGSQGQVIYGSFFGFDATNITPNSVEIDTLGRVYIAGDSQGWPAFLHTPNAFMLQSGDAFCDPNAPGCVRGDAFLIVFDTRFQGNASYPYASYIGGENRESDVAMTLDSNGWVHLVGNTQSPGTFPGLFFGSSTAIFDFVLDVNQPPATQLMQSGTIVEGLATTLQPAHLSGARFRLRPNGTYALLALTDDPNFPLIDPLYEAPRDPNAFVEMKPLLLVYSPQQDGFVLSTYLDDVTLAHSAHLASAPNGTLDVAMQTTEPGRSTSYPPIGQIDVLAFAIDGIGSTANHPPIASAGGSPQTYFSSSPAGMRVLLYGGSSFDQDGDPLTYVWTEGGNQIATGEFVEVLLTPGSHSITLTVDDGNGGSDTDTILVIILPNTPAGGQLTVTPEDLAWRNFGTYNRFPMTVQFTNVTADGFTSVTSSAPLPPVPPPGMQFGSPPHVYDVATTAAFTAPVTVCIDYRGFSFPRPNGDLQLYQQVNGTWAPLPQTNDTAARQICGATTTLGTFAVFSPAVAANEISILAGQPGRSSACFPPQGGVVQGPDPNEGGLATDSSLCVTRGLAYDTARNYLYFSEGSAADKIRRVDLATNRITTVAGTGFRTRSIDGPGGDPRDDDKNNVDPLTAPIAEALDLALDAAGNLLFAEFGPHGGRIRKVDFAQNLLFTVADVSAFSLPSTLAIDASGAVLFAGFSDAASHIWRVSPGADGVLNGSPDEALQIVAGTGANVFDPASIPTAGANPLSIGTPTGGLAFGPDGSLYVTVQLGMPSLLRIAGGPDGLVDGNGDTAFLVTSSSFATGPIMGDGDPVTSARLFSPWSVTVAPNGDVYVGDGGHFQASTVRRIQAGADSVVTGAPDEVISTVAGFHVFDPNIHNSEELPYSDGDGHALSSIFGAAWGLEALPNGDLLITDSFQVRRVGPRSGSSDTTPPVLTLPSPLPILAEAQNPTGAVVTFTVTATDNVDPSVPVVCSPTSGSTFGFTGTAPTTTTVTCSATDAAGNTATATFDVIVRDITPPVVTPPPHTVIAATQVTGARANVPQAPDTQRLLDFLAAGAASDAADPNPVRTLDRVNCLDPTMSLGPIDAATLFTVGRNCFELAFVDASGNRAVVPASFDVAPPIGGDIHAAGVPVIATDLNNVPQPITAEFVLLQQPGLLTATTLGGPPAPPAGMTLTSPAFDIRSTALAPTAISVCINLPGAQAGDRLFLFENGTWLDRTASVDVTTSRVCGVPTSLGIYATARASVVQVSVIERIIVADTPLPRPSAMVGVSERIAVADTPVLRPSAWIGVSERIAVRDAGGVVPPAVVNVIERIAVADTPRLLPSALVGVTERIAVRDSPVVTAIDTVPPVLTVPGTIVAEAQTPGGAVVTFAATATDNLPGPVQVSCSPASGSLFAFNGSSPTTTSVTCTATDGAGNVATGSFDVVVRDTSAPQVITAQITVAATEATGARGNVPQAPHTPVLQQLPLLGAAIDAGDANPARVSVQWVACANPADVLGPIADTTLYPVGVNCFSWVFRDASGNVGTGIGTITVSPPIGGHINVPNVPVTATDLGNVPLPVTATYLGLDQPGLLTAVPPPFIPPPPAGMIFAGAPFELHSTALAQAPVVVCMRPPVGEVAERLLALEFFQWVDRTETSTATGEICGRPGELGTFALVRRDLSGFTMTMTPVSAVRQAGFGHRVFIDVSDNSDPTARVMLQSRFEGSAEFLHPQVPNSPLSVTVQRNAQGVFSIVTVSLGTGPNGELISTARQVADSIHAHNGFGPVFAWTSENTHGEGIVAPKPLTPFTRLQVSTSNPGVNTSGLDTWCYVTLPALCVADLDPSTLPFAPFTLALTAYLDVNRNQVADAGELTAPGEVTWVDVTPPFLHIPANITVLAASPAGTAVSFTVPAFDNVDDGELPTSCSPASGSTFPIGTTTVTCTATDSSGNVGRGSFTVTVNAPPGQTPNLSLPGNLTVVATSPAGAVVNYTASATVGAFGGSFPIAVFCTPPSGSTFPVGTTTVTCTATNPILPPPLSFPATGSFTVTVVAGSTVSLVSPIGGEKVFVNVPVTIRWNATGAPASFDVLLSRGPNAPFSPVCASLPATATSCSWVPFGNATSQARIQVVASGPAGSATDTSGTFTISTAVPTITVTSPAWPQAWAIGTTQTISWQHNLGPSASFRLEVSRNWGASWELVAGAAPSTTATSGSFSWTVTGPAAAVAMVRVTWVQGGFDGGSVVAIEDPRITVTDSNGGDTWTIGSARTIRWSHNLGANQMVAVELSRDGGATWSPVVASTPNTGATSGQWAWTVTGPVTSRARIRVRWLANPAVGDQSNGDFTIASRIRVTSPNTAVSWVVGSIHAIRWTHQYGVSQLFDIDFSADGGASWSSFATGVPAATATSGTYSAAMPMTATTQGLFRVSPEGVPGDGDTSDVLFTLR
jgi:hypothetical protein